MTTGKQQQGVVNVLKVEGAVIKYEILSLRLRIHVQYRIHVSYFLYYFSMLMFINNPTFFIDVFKVTW